MSNKKKNTDVIGVRFSSYDKYLDSLLTNTDIFHLEDMQLCRELLMANVLPNRRNIPSLKTFQKEKASVNEGTLQASQAVQIHELQTCDKLNGELINELIRRKLSVQQKTLIVIIFIRAENDKGQEVSGYIDFAERLGNDDIMDILTRKKKLTPSTNDLSYYNWSTMTCVQNSSSGVMTITDKSPNLMFQCKHDSHIFNINTQKQKNPTRMKLQYDYSIQAVLYEHILTK